MKIAIVHDFLFKMGGAERVVKELADMFPKAPIYTLIYDEKKCGEAFPRERVISSSLKNYPRFLRKRPQYLLSKMPEAIESFDFSGFDLVISSSGAFSHGIITPPGTKHLCYCHSPMRYAWDYTHEYLEEKNYPFWKELIIRQLVHKVRQWDRAAADRPDKYIANSKHVARRIKKYYQIDADVLYPPVDVERFYPYEASGDYFLIVSTLTPYKKIDLAVSAFNKMGKRLVIIGGGKHQKYLESIAGPTVEVLGRKSDAEVKRYMQECKAFIFPSEEDFGITPVEAMAAGKPVIAYKKGGVMETVIDGITGVFFRDQNVRGMESAIAQFYEIEHEFEPSIIRKRAEEFSREKFLNDLKKTIDDFVAYE